MDQDENYDKSWMLYHILEGRIGHSDEVATRRKLTLFEGCTHHASSNSLHRFNAGSEGEGFRMPGSDFDRMFIDNTVIVTYPDEFIQMTIDSTTKTILLMRDTDGQPGYVALEIIKKGPFDFGKAIMKSIVAVAGVHYISSDMYRCAIVEHASNYFRLALAPHGPCATGTAAQMGEDIDFVVALPCMCWPTQAREWVLRPRHYGWPSPVLMDSIIQECCQLVPIGDKSSTNTCLQWRISFATSERKLVHSLSHHQFLVYGLLKIFLKQIKDMIIQTIGDADILSSYIMKTIIFWAVENTPQTFWQEQNTFVCFWFCINTLIIWVKSGFCPNYFIIHNNMFRNKVHGDNQQKLLRLLIDLHNMKWMCLSAGTYLHSTIGNELQLLIYGRCQIVIVSPMKLEWECDREIFSYLDRLDGALYPAVTLLTRTTSDVDDFIAYYIVVRILSVMAMSMYNDHSLSGSNKQKYNALRRCRNLLTPYASVCTSPGLLLLATYYYQTGCYMKALGMCRFMTAGYRLFFGDCSNYKNKEVYQHRCCGRNYSLYRKCREMCTSNVTIMRNSFSPSQLEPELNRLRGTTKLFIPPLPYSVFLSVLCYHELGDTRRRDEALINLRAVKYDEDQGGHNYWIVHNLVGICYEIVGDTRRAIREYNDSMNGSLWQERNPAMERIERLRHSR